MRACRTREMDHIHHTCVLYRAESLLPKPSLLFSHLAELDVARNYIRSRPARQRIGRKLSTCVAARQDHVDTERRSRQPMSKKAKWVLLFPFSYGVLEGYHSSRAGVEDASTCMQVPRCPEVGWSDAARLSSSSHIMVGRGAAHDASCIWPPECNITPAGATQTPKPKIRLVGLASQPAFRPRRRRRVLLEALSAYLSPVSCLHSRTVCQSCVGTFPPLAMARRKDLVPSPNRLSGLEVSTSADTVYMQG